MLEDDAHVAERIVAAGDGVDVELAQLAGRLDDLVECDERRVNRAIALTRRGVHLVALAHLDLGVRGLAGAGAQGQALKDPALGRITRLVVDDRLEIECRDRLLAIGDLLELGERALELVAFDGVAHVGVRSLQRSAARVLAQNELVVLQSNRLGVHDLVRAAVLQHAVLMDAGLVGEGVLAHDCLVRLYGVAAQARNQAAGTGDLCRLDTRLEAVEGVAGAQRHHDLLERRVASTLADTVDRDLDLTRTCLHAGQRIRGRETEIVVRVDAQRRLVQFGHVRVERGEDLPVLLRRRVADGIGDVDRRGAGGQRGAHDLCHELRAGARGVLAGEFDVRDLRPGVGNSIAGLLDDLLGRHAELVLHVEVARRDEDMEAGTLSVLEGLPRRVDVALLRAIERRDRAAAYVLGHEANALNLAGRGHCEAGLNDVDAEPFELARDLQLLLRVQANARRLLAIAQRGVEDLDVILIGAHRAPFRSAVRLHAPVLLSRRCLRRASGA